ncbi:probable UDP-sugar transporter protein SLC35A4 [Corticium candelabrum]|uniref:probable UDP-sugar transporter protein SLC35A4 n=1 Tax=Corticium candelabrum TaxID=121492 RepID=UPI002E26487C|nr:probable UDP-sugar transporter protein SLC35A4 [Corticium candelabrum]
MVYQSSWRFLIFSLSVALYGSHVVLINLSKDDNDRVTFNSATVVLMIEFGKFISSLLAYLMELLWMPEKSTSRQMWQRVAPLFDVASWIPYVVPAALYSVNNNLVVHIQHYTDPATFQVLSNMKIPTTALLYRLLTGRKIPRNKQVALLFLTIVGMSCSYSGIQAEKEITAAKGYEDTHRQESMRQHLSLLGLLLILIYSLVSGFAGVSIEMIMKRRAHINIKVQNVHLASFGIMINLLMYLTTADAELSFFSGYNIWTALIIVTQIANGMIISFVLKHLGNLTRLLIISCSAVVTTFVSHFLFELSLDLYFNLAVCLLFPTLYLYGKD